MTIAPTVGPSLPSGGMRSLMLLTLCLLVTGCGHSDERGGQRAKAAQADPPPAVDAPPPRTGSGLADALSKTTQELESGIRPWLGAHPGVRARPPEDVTLNALFQ